MEVSKCVLKPYAKQHQYIQNCTGTGPITQLHKNCYKTITCQGFIRPMSFVDDNQISQLVGDLVTCNVIVLLEQRVCDEWVA